MTTTRFGLTVRTLPEFLLARFGELEAAVNHAATTAPARIAARAVGGDATLYFQVADVQGHNTMLPNSKMYPNHFGNGSLRIDLEPYDPTYALADVEAKRAILDSHSPYEKTRGCCLRHDGREPFTYFDCEVCCEAEEYAESGGYCRTLRLLASVYADHSDYRNVWRP